MASLMFRLILAMVSGGIIGMERMRKRRPADSRTYMLVCIGAALAMLCDLYLCEMLAGEWADMAAEIGIKSDVSRFPAQVINGIGFLGAGTIIVNAKQQVKGITTSAGLWASACMGIAIGAGFYECVIPGVLIMFLCMRVMPYAEDALVETAPYINLYVEFESWDNLSTIISKAREYDAAVLDIDMDIGQDGESHSKNPSAILYFRLDNKRPHTRLMIAVAGLPCVYTTEEC